MEHFESGRTLVLPEEGEGLDPAEIAKAVREAGFTPARIEVRVEGTVETKDDSFLLRVDGLDEPFVLEDLQDKKGTRVHVRGELTLAKGARPRLKVVEAIE